MEILNILFLDNGLHGYKELDIWILDNNYPDFSLKLGLNQWSLAAKTKATLLIEKSLSFSKKLTIKMGIGYIFRQFLYVAVFVHTYSKFVEKTTLIQH